MDIPTTCEENAVLQTKILLALVYMLGITDDDILSQGTL